MRSLVLVCAVGGLAAACGGRAAPAPIAGVPGSPPSERPPPPDLGPPAPPPPAPPSDMPIGVRGWTDAAVVEQFRLARVARDAGDDAQATGRLAALLDHRPDHELARAAVDLLLDSLDRLGRVEELAEQAARLRRDLRLVLPDEQRRRLDEVAVQAELAAAQRLADALRWAECGDAFERVAHRFAGHRLAATALYNAAACWIAAGDLAHGVDLKVDLMRRYPSEPLAAVVREQLARTQRGIAP